MDTAMKTYSVTYRRDLGNDASLVEVGEMPDVCTYGRTLEEAAVNAREAVAVTVDVSKSEVELEEHFAVGGVDVEELASLRDRAQELHEIYLSRQRAAALRLAVTTCGASCSGRDSSDSALCALSAYCSVR